MRTHAHFRLSKPYLNKKTLHFERKVLGVGGQRCIPSSYANVTMIRRDVFDDVYYYPFNFNPRNNTWYGKCIGTAGQPNFLKNMKNMLDKRDATTKKINTCNC